MKQTHRLGIFLAIAILAVAVPVNGQNSTGNEGCNFCFSAKPKGKCCSFLIFEFGILARVSTSGPPPGKRGGLITADLGLMFNKNKTSAIGGSLHLSNAGNEIRFGLGPRYRKWLTERVALDLSPRLLIAGTDNGIDNHFPGFAFSAALAVNEWLSIDAYLEIIPYERQIYLGPSNIETVKGTQTGLYLGASGRAWGVLIPSAIIVIAGIAYGLGSSI